MPSFDSAQDDIPTTFIILVRFEVFWFQIMGKLPVMPSFDSAQDDIPFNSAQDDIPFEPVQDVTWLRMTFT
jgi:hypothetical protein